MFSFTHATPLVLEYYTIDILPHCPSIHSKIEVLSQMLYLQNRAALLPHVGALHGSVREYEFQRVLWRVVRVLESRGREGIDSTQDSVLTHTMALSSLEKDPCPMSHALTTVYQHWRRKKEGGKEEGRGRGTS